MPTKPAKSDALAALPVQANLTPLHIARFLDVSLMTVYREIIRGSFPVIHIGRTVRIPRGDFVAWYVEKYKQLRTGS